MLRPLDLIAPLVRALGRGRCLTLISGTIDSPLRTLQRARDVLRQSKHDGATIIIREGKYYLNDTLSLDERDSHVAFVSYSGEQVSK